MGKIKENLAIFFIVWGVVLFLNQVIIFRSCFAPQCLIAALPHTGIITFLLFILILKSDKEEKTDIGNIDIPNIEIELDDKKVVQPAKINNLFQFETKELQDEIKVETKTQISTKLNIRDISYPLNVPFKVIVKDIKKAVLCINIDNQEYLISKPKNNTWENISLKDGDILIVEKVSYGTKEKPFVKLNLLEINGKKNELRNNNVTIFGENELLILKKQLGKLEVIFQKLIEQKTEYLNDIEEFNNQYNIHLGELIRNILNLKKEILYKKTIKYQKIKEQFEKDKNICNETKQTINELKNTVVELEEILENIDEDNESYEEIKNAYDELKEELKNIEEQLLVEEQELERTKEKIEEDEVFQEEYEEANSTYEEFDNEYEHIKDIQKDVKKLNEEDKKELKLLYKKAAKLCHPDIVSDEFKEKAHEIMQLLNDAYSKKDINEVRKILLNLENGKTFKTISKVINNKELLESKIKEFGKNILDLEKEINIIKEDDTYKIISTLENWDEYFEELKNELQKEKNILEDEARSVLEEKVNKEEILEQAVQIKASSIEKENSKYSKAIKDIENPNFEKIRRYCNNLLSDNQVDDMQKYLAENGKTYKALIYDSLEQFLIKLDGENITVVDWGSTQGIASMLVLDYIKEKQLNIKVEELFLVDNDKKSLSRAMAQVDVLNIDKREIKAIYSKESKNLKELDNIKSNITLNLFANDLMPVNYSQINLLENSYIMCISNQNKSFVDDIYENMKRYGDFENISFRDSKIGKFQRFEKIFKKTNKNIIDYDIDEDEIPF